MSNPSNNGSPGGQNIPPHIFAQIASLLGPFLGGSSAPQPEEQPAVSTRTGPLILPTLPATSASSASAPPSIIPSNAPVVSQSHGIPSTNAHATSSVLPVISPYQSLRLPTSQANQRFHPYSTQPHTQNATSSSGGAAGTPRTFLGFQNTRNANRQRLASASATLPRRVSLAPRAPRSVSSPATGTSGAGRRTRGPSGALPSMAQPTGFDVAIFQDGSGADMIKIRAKVYPPLGDDGSGHYVYLNHRDSFNQALARNHLLHDLVIPIDTSVRQLFTMVTDLLSNSPFRYTFAPRSSHLLPHEASPITLLRLNNRGRIRPSTGHIYLVNNPILSNAIDIRYLTRDTTRFVVPEISFEEERFVLFFGIAGNQLTAHIPNNTGRIRVHNCISRRIYSQFPDDSPESQDNPTDGDTSGGEDGDGDASDSERSSNTDAMSHADEEERLEVEAEVRVPSIPVAIAPRQAPQRIARVETAVDLPSYATTAPLWSQPWVAPPEAEESFSVADADTEIFVLAQGGFRGLNLELRAPSAPELAELLIAKIKASVDADDFGQLLSPNREFIITHPLGSANEATRRSGLLSVGEGVEKEVLFLAFKTFERSAPRWFLPRAGGFSSIAITNRFPSTTRLKDLSVLGALAGLMIINGIAPEPLSPLLLHFIIHGCKLDSIHPQLVKEWIPELHNLIQAWLLIGPEEQDLSPFTAHFSTFHDIQIASLLDRDMASHQALAAEMLYRAVIGPESSCHPELQAFIKGFSLYCPRSGFSISKLATSIRGGSEALFNMLWTSQIKGFDDLASHLRFLPLSPVMLTAIAAPLQRHGLPSFKVLLENFLSGVGIPCPTLFDSARNHFTSIIDLDDIEKPSFRAKYFCWAATGSPSIQITSPGISIALCPAGDLNYAHAGLQGPMMAQGTIAFKTCTQQVKFPAPYLIRLLLATYQEDEHPSSLQAAFDHWVLCEILNAIAGHTIL